MSDANEVAELAAGERVDLNALLADSQVNEVLDELDRELIGLVPVKTRVRDIAALLAHAQLYRCEQCGLAGMRFYWQCPGCHAWDSFETCVIISLV